jgi:hypothetical protein
MIRGINMIFPLVFVMEKSRDSSVGTTSDYELGERERLEFESQ